MLQMTGGLRLAERLVLILSWAIHLRHWQTTHALEDISAPETAAPSALECCVCFETNATPRKACIDCGSNFPVCERCLHSWSWAVGSVKSCVVCRGDERPPSRHRRSLDLHLQEMSPLRCVLAIILYLFLHYSWLIWCYRTATRTSLF